MKATYTYKEPVFTPKIVVLEFETQEELDIVTQLFNNRTLCEELRVRLNNIDFPNIILETLVSAGGAPIPAIFNCIK